MQSLDFGNLKGAIFSEDRQYRYVLWRMWSSYKKPLLFIGLNPSTASELTDDPTITRLTRRASDNGFGGLLVGNLFALVSANPDKLLETENPVGTLNDDYTKQMIGLSDKVLFGWGQFTNRMKLVIDRAEIVKKMVQNPYCLGITQKGFPKHPLYIPYETELQKYVFATQQ